MLLSPTLSLATGAPIFLESFLNVCRCYELSRPGNCRLDRQSLQMPKKILPRRKIVQFLAAASIGGRASALALPPGEDCPSSSDRVAWAAASLKRMLSIMPGMSRDQLLRVFTTEGGKSTALQRTFVSRDCPFFKVDVTFRRATGPTPNTTAAETPRELDDDVVETVSRPYLQFSIID